jgi:hypothetical protein
MVRALAGMIHIIGLLPPDQLNIADYASDPISKAAIGTT